MGMLLYALEMQLLAQFLVLLLSFNHFGFNSVELFVLVLENSFKMFLLLVQLCFQSLHFPPQGFFFPALVVLYRCTHFIQENISQLYLSRGYFNKILQQKVSLKQAKILKNSSIFSDYILFMLVKSAIRKGFSSRWMGARIGSGNGFCFSEGLVKQGKERLVGGWLFLTAAGVLGMIVLGGYTRLTHSGLSMADWSPYTKRYPRNQDEWNIEFDKYKKTIEFQTVNREISLQGFKPIYWVEFFHRQMGMVLGYWFAIPFAVFQFKGYLQPKLRNRLIALLGLGGLQGAIGWWMVKSGLKEKPQYQSRPRVSPYRLATHLGMATALYSGLLWNAFSLLIKPTEVDPQDLVKLKYLRGLRLIGIVMIKCLILNILTGAFVAGIDAGRMYNTWPLMNGQVVPDGLVKQNQPLWKNFFENVAMVQFNHRNMAYITMSLSYLLLYRILKARIGGPFTVAGMLAVMMINYQALSGILTLLNLVPKEKANMHQMTAVITLSTVLLMVYMARVPIPPIV